MDSSRLPQGEEVVLDAAQGPAAGGSRDAEMGEAGQQLAAGSHGPSIHWAGLCTSFQLSHAHVFHL